MNIDDIRRFASQIDINPVSVSPSEADEWFLQFGEMAPANDNGRLSMQSEDVREALVAFVYECRERKIDPVYDDVEAFTVFSRVLARRGCHPVLQLQMMDHVDAVWPHVAPYDPFDDFFDRASDNVVMLGY